jgi:hypothetical protein
MENVIAGLLFAIACGVYGGCHVLDKILVELQAIRKMREHDFDKQF